MADLDERLSVLTVGLGDPPSPGELEQRVQRRRRRRRAAQGLGGVAAAVALVAGAVTLTSGGDANTTVRAAAPPGGDASVASPTTVVPFDTPVLLDAFGAGTPPWAVYARRMSPDTNCLELWGGPTIAPGWCWNGPFDQASMVVKDYGAFQLLLGIVPLGTKSVRLGDQPLRLLGDGFGARFVDALLPAGADGSNVVVDVDGTQVRPESTPDKLGVQNIHRRVDSINGQPVPPTFTPPGAIQPPAPPAKRVTVTAGATNLQKHVFDTVGGSSAAPLELVVSFWDGIEPCSVLGRVDLVETADKVTITLWTGTGPGAGNLACPAIAQQKETVVRLAAPLGNRTIVDGAK